MAVPSARVELRGIEESNPMMLLVKILQWPIGWMQSQIEQISGFLWHYYLILILTMVVLSSVTVKICARAEIESTRIRNSSSPAVDCRAQLNDITSKLKR
jgi:hypothetical protein